MLDLSQLNLLVIVDSSKNLSSAAEKLNISQSAVSQMLKTIESKLEISLFYRQGKNLSLTPKAQKLVKFAKQYLKKFDELYADLKDENNKIIGKISLGTLFGLGKSWVGHQLIEFSSIFDDLSVEVIFEFPNVLIEKFNNHELDCLILAEHMLPNNAKKLFLHEERTTLIFPKSNKFKINKDTSLEELINFPLIFFEEHDPLFHRWCKSVYGHAPKNIKPKFTINSFGQMLFAISEKLGIAVIPTHVLERSTLKNKIQTLGEDFEIVNDKFYFAYHNDNFEQMKMKVLVDYLTKSGKKYSN